MSQNPPCGAFYSLDYSGEFTGSVTINSETYTGPFTISFEDHLEHNQTTFDHDTDAHWHANPSGLYAPDDHTCSGAGDYALDLTNVKVKMDPLPEPRIDQPGIVCDANNGVAGNNNGSLQRTDSMLDVTGVKASCETSDGTGSAMSGEEKNVRITIDSTFAGPCWRTDQVFPFPPQNCVTEDVVVFHQ